MRNYIRDDDPAAIHRDFDAAELKHKAVAVVIALVILAACAAWYWSQA